MREKIIHCQVALLQSTILRLKEKAGTEQTAEALNTAVEAYIREKKVK